MANTQCTLILETEKGLPKEALFVVYKNLFRWDDIKRLFFLNWNEIGVKNMSLRESKVLISLTYSPRHQTMIRKMGNLPAQYRRVIILENVVQIQIWQ